MNDTVKSSTNKSLESLSQTVYDLAAIPTQDNSGKIYRVGSDQRIHVYNA